jgi:hypothetical protein
MSTADLPEGARELYDRVRGELPGLAEAPRPIETVDAEPASSLIAELRAQHARIARRTHTTIELPRGLWAGKLAVRYRYPDERSFDRLVTNAVNANDSQSQARANVDLMIAGCEEVVGRADDGDAWGPIIDGERVRYDKRLSDALGLGVDSARDVVYALFAPPGADARVKAAMAIGAHADLYVKWLQGETPEVVEALSGESPAPGA